MSTTPIVSVTKGTIIYEQGQPCTTMFVLQSGTIGLYLNWATPTQFQLLEISKVGTMFGEMGLFEKDPRNATAIALTDCMLLEISSESFPRFVQEHPDQTINIILDLSQRFKMALQEIKAGQEIIAESLAALKEMNECKKDTLKDRIKRISDYLLDIPEDVPPELYLSLNSRFHGTMY